MWRNLLKAWRTVGPVPANAALSQRAATASIPHPDWNGWLAQGNWDRAAVCLKNLQEAEVIDSESKQRLPQWQSRLVRAFLKNAWADLAPGTALRWLRRVDRFADRGLNDASLDQFRSVADQLWDLERLQRQGQFQEAAIRLDSAHEAANKAQATLKFNPEDLRRQLLIDHETLLESTIRMRIYSDEGRHPEAAELARQVLSLAPEHPGALAVLRSPGVRSSPQSDEETGPMRTIRLNEPITTGETLPVSSDSPTASRSPENASGEPLPEGFWHLCFNDGPRWLLTTAGQFEINRQSPPELQRLFGFVPHMSPLVFSRDEEGCWLFQTESKGHFLNGREAGSGCLMDSARFRLNGGPEFVFRQPRMETGSARLEHAAGQPGNSFQGLVLLGDFLLMGADASAELPIRGLTTPVTIVGSHGKLIARVGVAGDDRRAVHSMDVPIHSPFELRVGDTLSHWELLPLKAEKAGSATKMKKD